MRHHATAQRSISLFSRIGGSDGVIALVDAYIHALCTRDDVIELRKLYENASLEKYRARLIEFLTGWLGGPTIYQARHGMPLLREGHRSIHINEDLCAQWNRCMRDALSHTINDPALRLHLEGVFNRLSQSLINVRL